LTIDAPNIIALRTPEIGESPDESRQKPIEDYLAPGVVPEDVRGLAELSPVRSFQPLLRELLLGGPDDFWVRLFFMRELLADAETSWTQEGIASKFPQFGEEPRRDIVRRLTRGGWLGFADGRYAVTALGETAISITGLLGDLANRVGDLGLVVHSLKMAHEYGLDASTQLDQLRHKLAVIGEQMERAYDSKSEHAILEARKMLESSLPWVESARQVLETYTLDTPEEHERVRSTHDLLSRLHHWVSALQRALNDIGKRRIHLGEGGLTMRDITAFLARADVNSLVALTNGIIYTAPEMRFVIPDNMLSEAEYEICVREVPEEDRRGWSDPTHAESVEPELAAGGPIEDFVYDMRRVITDRQSIAVSKFVSRESWATTAYRFTLLALAGGRIDVDAEAENLGPGRLLASLPIDVEFDHTKRDVTNGEFSSEMTSGRIVPRGELEADDAADEDAPTTESA
jgi:hypothetical protein